MSTTIGYLIPTGQPCKRRHASNTESDEYFIYVYIKYLKRKRPWKIKGIQEIM